MNKDTKPVKAFRPIFRRNDTFVAVKRIRLSADAFIEPGTIIETNDYSRLQKLRWYRARWIGKADSAWAKQMLEVFKAKKESKKPAQRKNHQKPKQTNQQSPATPR